MRKVLIITYYWPPAGGPGVQRVLKFVKYLPEFGWEPVILTVENGDYPAIDESLCTEIPGGLHIYKTRTLEPFKAFRKVTGKSSDQVIPTFILNSNGSDNWRDQSGKWARANFFIPDARLGWIPFARQTGRKILSIENIAVILTSSPPHSLQLIGRALARQTGRKWVADLRDPWTEAFWQRELNATAPARYINRRMEKAVLNSADDLITVSPSIAELLRIKSGKNCKVIPNGFDADDFKGIKKSRNEKFTITYSGNLSKDQPITALLNVLKNIKTDALNQIEVNLYGSVHDRHLAEIAVADMLNVVNVESYLPHRELITRIVNSDILLLIIPETPDNKGILTGKVFEYMATGNFILGIGPEEGDAARLLKETNTGVMHAYSDDLKAIILEHFRHWQEGRENKRTFQKFENYSRRSLTGELAKILDKQIA